MSTPMELNQYGLWGGKQSAKGTPNAAPAKRLIQVGGDFNAPRTDGREEWSDLSEYGGVTDWVDTLVGNGNPSIEATPEELAWLLWIHHGAEGTAAVTGPPAKTKHTYVPSSGLGFWATFFKRVGVSQIQRHQYNDCQVGQVVIEGSTALKAVRITPTVISLDPAEVKAADPSAAPPTKTPFLYTDGTGTFTLNGNVHRGHSQFQLTLNKDLQPIYSDDVTVYDLGIGNPNAAISCTVFFDADGLARWNEQLYGTPTPAAGTKPLHNLPARGSYSFYLKAKDSAGALNGDEFKLTIPASGVKWTLPDSPGPNPAGGASEVAFAGELRQQAPGTPIYTIDVNNDAAAFTA